MEICSGSNRYRHDEIVFDRGDCPCCALVDERFDLQNKIEELNATISELEEEAE